MEIYLVGGAVRDQLMGIKPKDFDYVVVGETEQSMVDAGFKKVGKDFPVFLDSDGDEYALARQERTTGAGHNDFVCHTENVTLKEDLMRRDLTINAIAQNTKTGEIIDPFGGVQDIEDKVLKHVSDAFMDDPVRVLRLARFSAKFPDFKIYNMTKILVRIMNCEGLLSDLEDDRIRREIRKVLCEPNSELFFITLQKLGALKQTMPEIYEYFKYDDIKKYLPNLAYYDGSDISEKDLITRKTVNLLYKYKNHDRLYDKHWFKNKDLLLAKRISENLPKFVDMKINCRNMYFYFKSFHLRRDDHDLLYFICESLETLEPSCEEYKIDLLAYWYEYYDEGIKSLKWVNFKLIPDDLTIEEFKDMHIMEFMSKTN